MQILTNEPRLQEKQINFILVSFTLSEHVNHLSKCYVTINTALKPDLVTLAWHKLAWLGHRRSIKEITCGREITWKTFCMLAFISKGFEHGSWDVVLQLYKTMQGHTWSIVFSFCHPVLRKMPLGWKVCQTDWRGCCQELKDWVKGRGWAGYDIIP